MTTVSAEIQIAAPKAKVWAIPADLGDVERFHPFVTKSYYQPTSTRSGVGASRVCEFGPALSVRETAVNWREVFLVAPQGNRVEEMVLEIQFPIDKASARAR